MNKKLLSSWGLICVVLIWLLIAYIVYTVTTQSENENADEVTTDVSNNTIEEIPVGEDEEVNQYTPQNILIDYNDINKMLFEYKVEEFTQDELNYCINYTLESYSVYTPVSMEISNSMYQSVRDNADAGTVYLVIRVVDDNLYINVCTYSDRVNPVYSVNLLLEGESWTII